MLDMIKKKFQYWYNLGFTQNEIVQYSSYLNKSNISNLYLFCRALSIVLILIMVFCTFILHVDYVTVLCILGLDLELNVLAVLSYYMLRNGENHQYNYANAMIYIALLSSYFVTFFIQNHLYSGSNHTIVFLLIFINQFIFDLLPIHNLLITFFVCLSAGFLFVQNDPTYIWKYDFIFLFIASAVGHYIAWKKTAGKFALLVQGDLDLQLQEENAKMHMMSNQIRPFFVYNMMTTIMALIKKNSKQAYDASVLFALYLRSTLDSIVETKCISFEEEFNHIQTYYSLEKIRFGKKIYVEFMIETMDFRLPALTVEPLIENCIKHCVNKNEGPLHIYVDVHDFEDHVEITVRDDGTGFTLGSEREDGIEHFGLKNVARRLSTMQHTSMYLKSEVGVGTTVIIVIPKEGIYFDTLVY